MLNQSYVWDSLNRMTQRNDANGDGNNGAVGDSFGYDDIGRLTSYAVSAPQIPNLSRIVTLQNHQRVKGSAALEQRHAHHLEAAPGQPGRPGLRERIQHREPHADEPALPQRGRCGDRCAGLARGAAPRWPPARWRPPR